MPRGVPLAAFPPLMEDSARILRNAGRFSTWHLHVVTLGNITPCSTVDEPRCQLLFNDTQRPRAKSWPVLHVHDPQPLGAPLLLRLAHLVLSTRG